MRSHSLAWSSHLGDLFVSKGLTNDLNLFVPSDSGIVLRPWKLQNGLTRIPHHFADDYVCATGKLSEGVRRNEGLNVLDFHPIHLFLNSNSLEAYELARPHFRDIEELRSHRSQQFGCADLLEKVVSEWSA